MTPHDDTPEVFDVDSLVSRLIDDDAFVVGDTATNNKRRQDMQSLAICYLKRDRNRLRAELAALKTDERFQLTEKMLEAAANKQRELEAQLEYANSRSQQELNADRAMTRALTMADVVEKCAKVCRDIKREQIRHSYHDRWNGPDTAEACAEAIEALPLTEARKAESVAEHLVAFGCHREAEAHNFPWSTYRCKTWCGSDKCPTSEPLPIEMALHKAWANYCRAYGPELDYTGKWNGTSQGPFESGFRAGIAASPQSTDELRRDAFIKAFVAGARHERYSITGATQFPSERDIAEAEAVKLWDANRADRERK